MERIRGRNLIGIFSKSYLTLFVLNQDRMRSIPSVVETELEQTLQLLGRKRKWDCSSFVSDSPLRSLSRSSSACWKPFSRSSTICLGLCSKIVDLKVVAKGSPYETM